MSKFEIVQYQCSWFVFIYLQNVETLATLAGTETMNLCCLLGFDVLKRTHLILCAVFSIGLRR